MPEKEAKKSAAQKRMETMENVKLIMAMNKDFAGNGVSGDLDVKVMMN